MFGTPPGVMEENLPPQEGYGLVINGASLTFALKRKYERLFLEVACLCSVRLKELMSLIDFSPSFAAV